MFNKKGMELSVNFMVILIVSLIVFGMALTVVYKVIDKGNKLVDDMDSQTEQELKRLMSNGNKVSVYPHNIEFSKEMITGVGITNKLEDAECFKIKVSCDKFFPEVGNAVNCSSNFDLEMLGKSGNNAKSGVLVEVPYNDNVLKTLKITANDVDKGRYKFLINVSSYETCTSYAGSSDKNYYPSVPFYVNLD